jgi:chemotaxis regulatin CheY-phosphate phosphatase CheZ
MNMLEWAVQIAVIGLLGATLPMAWRLDRMLRAVRADRVALQQGADGLGEASRQAEAALMRLRATTELAGRQVAERVAGAEAIREDLRYLVERAESLADRLEAAVQQARPLAGAATPTAQSVRSEAERELIRALGMK